MVYTAGDGTTIEEKRLSRTKYVGKNTLVFWEICNNLKCYLILFIDACRGIWSICLKLDVNKRLY